MAKEAEALGIESFWLNEDIGRDAISLLGTVALATQRIHIATGVINTYTRTPMLIAMTATTLSELSEGRAIMGLTDAHTSYNALAHGIIFEPIETAPKRMRDFLQLLHKILEGDTVTWETEYFKIGKAQLSFRPPPYRLPIYINARQPEMLQVGGEIADGVNISIATPQWVREFALPNLAIGAEKAGRSVEEIDIAYHPILCMSEDYDKAMNVAKQMFLGYMENPEVITLLKSYGYRKEVEAFEEAKATGGRREAPPESLVSAIALVGTPEEVRHRIAEYIAAGVKLYTIRAQCVDKGATETALSAMNAFL